VPPAGSSVHLRQYATRYGCNVTGDFRRCLWEKFQPQLSKLKPDPKLLDGNLIKERLSEAKVPLKDSATSRFTSIPAACGSETGTLHLGMVDANQTIRGGAISGGGGSHAGIQMDVPMVDVAEWIIQSFSPNDHVLVKMDIEGAEFGILQNCYQIRKENVLSRLSS